MKICIKCEIKKDLEQFYSSKSYKDGKMGTCKSCFNKRSDKKKEYETEYKKEYRKKQSYIDSNNKWKQNNINYNKEWYQNNKVKINKYQQDKKSKNILYKISCNMRTRISQTLSNYSKSKSTLNILGLNNFNDFKQYIETMFTDGMNWENYGFGKGKWVIDHRIPLASAKNEDEICKLNYHTNLQPMWWDENMIKGVKI
jgi:hypothetical protein